MRTHREPALLVYDGDCGFCTTAVRFAERRVRPRCRTVPWQEADLVTLGVTRERAEREVLWVTPDGTVRGGAQAVAAALLSAGGAWSVAGTLLRLPLLRRIADVVYRVVAANRHRLPGGTPACGVRGTVS
ncbi:DUF393 domain-containing protein [Streptomyces albus subsp. chlorinus]|uniref:thiol-disulfide oxidoreductase DCC family protein n=1 Tax=Streptomyces albus TaxID=1888 RepID=UPI00156EDB3A|nr:DCC1-like thiol-disulfide oxidoreductase family protein [Streptomyces albus]NSC21973.1 DUF393 domain-containing protein [Streptomyces albus subsp. chlorinus]